MSDVPPTITLRRGSYYVNFGPESQNGPWATREAAEFAAARRWHAAERANNKAPS